MSDDVGLRENSFRLPVRLGAALLLFLAAACAVTAPLTSHPTEDAAGSSAKDTQLQPLPTNTRTEAAIESLEPVSTGSMNDSGSWLLVSTRQGLLMLHPDGSGRTALADRTVLAPGPLQNAVSPPGDAIVFITSSDPISFVHNLTLQIISFPLAAPVFSQKLTSPETEPEGVLFMGEAKDQINRALTEIPSFAWAPRGLRLAFIGAFEGPSADVYTYTVADGTIARHSNGPDQAYRPYWSPDGRYLIRTSASNFGTGAGIGVRGIYAARVEDGVHFPLYEVPEYSADEVGLGWMDPETLVVETVYLDVGPSDLRLVNLETRRVTTLKEGPVFSAAVASSGGTLVFSTGDGLYQVMADSPAAVKISEQVLQEIRWSAEADAFFAKSADGTVYEITRNGSVQPTPSKGLPIVSPDGRYWAWIPVDYMETVVEGWAGVWAGERGQVQSQIFPEQVPVGVAQLIWARDSQSFYFLDYQGNLYRTMVSDWNPILIASGLGLAPGYVCLAWAG